MNMQTLIAQEFIDRQAWLRWVGKIRRMSSGSACARHTAISIDEIQYRAQ